MLQEKAQQKQQAFTLTLAPQTCLVEGNGALLQSLLRNIIDNAIRYSPMSGEIKIECLKENHKVVIQISDSGPGIPAELRARVTERFYRVTGSGQQGSGLGLSIVDTIADLHNAHWQLVDSELGGLCVRFEFSAKKD